MDAAITGGLNSFWANHECQHTEAEDDPFPSGPGSSAFQHKINHKHTSTQSGALLEKLDLHPDKHLRGFPKVSNINHLVEVVTEKWLPVATCETSVPKRVLKAVLEYNVRSNLYILTHLLLCAESFWLDSKFALLFKLYTDCFRLYQSVLSLVPNEKVKAKYLHKCVGPRHTSYIIYVYFFFYINLMFHWETAVKFSQESFTPFCCLKKYVRWYWSQMSKK